MRPHSITKCLTVLAVLLVAGGSASGQANDTLREVFRYGILLETQGHVIPITYQEDGVYTGEMGDVTFAGRWRLDGATRLCASSSLSPLETCTTYPPGMAPGDTFQVTSPTLGQVRITIRQPEEG